MKRNPKHNTPTLDKRGNWPLAFGWIFDDCVPNWVKTHYSPRDSWKGKPFAKEDAGFFFRGIEELSELFTEERPRKLPQYFQHPRFRSAYLLYFLPLQTAKFLTLFQLHSKALDVVLSDSKAGSPIRIADLGSGPGTASLAFLLELLNRNTQTGMSIPQIEFFWSDTNETIMKEGKELIGAICDQFPSLRGKVQIVFDSRPWWEAAEALPEMSFIFMGHLLNETALPNSYAHAWNKLIKKAGGAGILIVEPAIKSASQRLSQLRNQLLETELADRPGPLLWGPCLHQGLCPLSDGRDWCHFSAPAEVPGKWFKEFSKGLGSERQWLKYSYLWIASEKYPASTVSNQMRRVVSDPLPGIGKNHSTTILLCEPETPLRIKVKPTSRVRRGDIFGPISQNQQTR